MEGVTLGLGSLEDKRDMVGSVQGGAIGIVKNLCKGSRASQLSCRPLARPPAELAAITSLSGSG